MYDFRPKANVHIPKTGETYPCAIGESLLRGMMKLGRKGIPVGCVNGGCGVCKVRVLQGAVDVLGPISRAHVSEAEQVAGYFLACRVGPVCAVQIEVCGQMQKSFLKGHAVAAGHATVAKADFPTKQGD